MLRYGSTGIAYNESIEVQLCTNPTLTRKIILNEVFGLHESAGIVDILQVKPKLPQMPERLLTEKKIKSIKVSAFRTMILTCWILNIFVC